MSNIKLKMRANTVAYYENAEELKIRILELLPKLVGSLDAPPKHVGSLELAFDDEATVEFVIERLRSLQRLYTAVCRLAGVSTSRFPLTVQQLEAGSLWLKLFGESRIIAVCSKVIDAAIRHLYRHHTREGQVAEIPNQIKLLEASLELSRKLEEAGIDATEIRSEVAEATLEVVASLRALVRNTDSISIGKSRHRLRSRPTG